MKIVVLDDERLALEQIAGVLEEVFQNQTEAFEIQKYQNWKEALQDVSELKEKQECLDYAFLDIKMPGIKGIEVAKQIKEVFPETKIIFVTGHSDYACEAFQLHALGYILKPATKESVEEVLDALVLGWRESRVKKRVRVQTFGNFEIFVDEKPVAFERRKAKELLAYLVDRKGAGISTAEISAVLWEDKEYDKKLKNQTQKIISTMMKALKDVDADNIIVKSWNSLAVNTHELDCDYYDFLNEDGMAVNAYTGEYMNNYSWAEFTSAALSMRQ